MYIVNFQGINACSGVSSIAAALSWSLSIHGNTVLFLNAASQNFSLCTDSLVGLDKDNLPKEGWSDYFSHNYQKEVFYLLEWGKNCYYLPFGKTAISDEAPEFVDRLIKKLGSLSKIDFLVVDAGTRESRLAEEFSKASSLSVTLITPESNTVIKLEECNPRENEYFLLNKFMMKSIVMNDIELLLRKSKLSESMFKYVVQYDESMMRASMQMMPVTRYLPIASASKSIEKLMVDIILICRLTDEKADEQQDKAEDYE